MRLNALQKDLAEADAALSEALREDTGLDRAIEEARQKRDRAREGLMTGEAQGQAWRSEVDRAGSKVTDAKVIAARAKERATAARNAVHRLERSVEELKTRGDRLEAEPLRSTRPRRTPRRARRGCARRSRRRWAAPRGCRRP